LKQKKSTATKTVKPGGTEYWAKGVGFGYDGGYQEWDTTSYLTKQQTKDEETEKLLKSVLDKLHPGLHPTTLKAIEKYLVPVLEFYLFGVSFLEMDTHFQRYKSLLSICCVLFNESELTPLFFKGDRSNNIYHITKTLKSQIKLLKSQSTDEEKKSSTGSSEKLSEDVEKLWKLLKKAQVKEKERKKVEATKVQDEKQSQQAIGSEKKLKKIQLLTFVWKLLCQIFHLCGVNALIALISKSTKKDSTLKIEPPTKTTTTETNKNKKTEPKVEKKTEPTSEETKKIDGEQSKK